MNSVFKRLVGHVLLGMGRGKHTFCVSLTICSHFGRICVKCNLEQGPAYVTEPFVSLFSTQLKLNGIHTDEEGTIHDPALLMEVCLLSLCALTLNSNSQFFDLFFPLF